MVCIVPSNIRGGDIKLEGVIFPVDSPLLDQAAYNLILENLSVSVVSYYLPVQVILVGAQLTGRPSNGRVADREVPSIMRISIFEHCR